MAHTKISFPMARYEMHDLPRDRPSTGIPLLSGGFMFCRRAPVAAIGGFAEDFFLCFKDFDLAVRAAARGDRHGWKWA